MRKAKLQNILLKTIRVLLIVALVALSLAALLSYLCYQLLAITIGVLVVIRLISQLQKSRRKAEEYRWGTFIGAIVLCVAFTVSLEFNFLLTLPVRQRIVNHFVETHKPPQYDVPIPTILLGKTTGNVGSSSDDVAIYFRYYSVIPAVGERAFMIFTTRPIAKIEDILYAERGTAKQLKKNWFFIHTKAIGFD